MSEFLNECCTVKTNRRTVGKCDALNADIVKCDVCGTGYTSTKRKDYVFQSSKPIIKTK